MSKEITTDELRQLLPFHVNGTLSDGEQATVDAALTGNATLQAERGALARLRDTMQDTPVDFTPGEFGLARLQRAIDAEPKPQAAPTTGQPWLRVAAAAAIFAVGVGAASLFQQDEAYIQASGSDGYDANHVLTVTFQPDIAQGDLTAMLQDLGLVIVDGPSAIGLYRLDPGKDTDLEQMAERLSSQSDMIESVALP